MIVDLEAEKAVNSSKRLGVVSAYSQLCAVLGILGLICDLAFQTLYVLYAWRDRRVDKHRNSKVALGKFYCDHCQMLADSLLASRIKRQPISLARFIVPRNVQIARRCRMIKPSRIFEPGFCLWVISWLYLTLPEAPALATTKGLNQIVTPDVQPQGDLSLSFQWQGQEIANPYEFQAELGITKWFEIAIFQGLKPQETIFGCEVGLVQKGPGF